MSAPRYFLITNDAARCALVIWCHLGNLPPSISVIDNPDHMLKIPDGAQVRCFWFGTHATIAAWESWWTTRRLQGGFDWISDADWETIMQWAERSRMAPVLRMNLGIEIEIENPSPSSASRSPAALGADLSPSIGVDLGPSPLKSISSICPGNAGDASKPARGEVGVAPAAPSLPAIAHAEKKRTSKWT